MDERGGETDAAEPPVIWEQRQRVVLDMAIADRQMPHYCGSTYSACSPGAGHDAAHEFDSGTAIGSGTSRIYRLADGLHVAFADLHAHAPRRLRIHGDGLVTIRIMLAGRTRLSGDGFAPIDAQGPLVTIFEHRRNQVLLHEVAGGVQRVVTLLATPAYLREELTWNLHDCDAPTMLPLTAGVEKLARDILRNRLVGPRHGVFVTSRALDLLCCLASEWDLAAKRDEGARRLTARDCRNIHLLRERLVQMAHRPPSMAQLSRLAGMNRSKLMGGFKQMFGETIADFCRRLRLEEAQAMLLTQHLPIGDVAAAVGYRHQSSFAAAFSAHFGYPPRALKRPSGTRVARGLN